MKLASRPNLKRILARLPALLALFAAPAHWIPLSAAGPEPITSLAVGPAEVVVIRDGEDYLRFGVAAWGARWSWAGIEGQSSNVNGRAVAALRVRIGDSPLALGFSAGRTTPTTLQLNYDLLAAQSTELTLVVAELSPGRAFRGREVVIGAQGTTSKARLPFGQGILGQAVDSLRLTDQAGRQTAIRFDPPCEITTDGAARLVLAKERLAMDGPRRLTVTVELPEATAWFASAAEVPPEPGFDAWYPWQASGAATDSALSMADWLDKPAGKHGRLRREGDRLLAGTQAIKLWGLNLCYGSCAPDERLADQRAAFYPRYGINAVRLHKFADGAGWDGIQAPESAAEYDPAGLERMDYQVAKFKEAGIYVKLSAHFGSMKMGPADRRDVPYLDEFGSFVGGRNRVGAPHSAFFYSPELQNLQVRQMVNLLRHRNPHTGLTYAEDPAICAVEIINEQSILFFTSMAPLQQSATLRQRVGERFSDWLRQKYDGHAALLEAWGDRALNGFERDGFVGGEHLDRRNILPLGNPWYWDPDQLNGSQAFRKQRLLDTLQFLYELQVEAYDRYVAAVREAGYEGEILGSNWQAGRAFSHYANLHSDYLVGLIDRHNYFGGGRRGGSFDGSSMLARAGSGSLSSGLQQAADRPFMLSEWIHVFPNEWGVEGPAILGAFGFGLQGWDVSFMFQNGDQARFSEQLGRQEWDVMAPQILGVFPAVARQVLRGDVTESTVRAVRNVHVPSIFQGRLGFEDKVVQGYDDKEFDGGQVPARALAAARCVVRFTDAWAETPAFDLNPYLQGGAVVSSTQELRWKEGEGRRTAGYFTMNTAGTKAVVGFAEGQPCDLGPVSITPRSRFAAIYVTAAGRHETLATSRRLLIVALARARNTGMMFSPTGEELLERGRGPVLMEPVKADFAIRARRVISVQRLDHDGCRTEATLPVVDGRFTIDGATDRTPYYEVILGAEAL